MRVDIGENGKKNLIITKEEWASYGSSMGWSKSKPREASSSVIREEGSAKSRFVVMNRNGWLDIGKTAKFIDDNEYLDEDDDLDDDDEWDGFELDNGDEEDELEDDEYRVVDGLDIDIDEYDDEYEIDDGWGIIDDDVIGEVDEDEQLVVDTIDNTVIQAAMGGNVSPRQIPELIVSALSIVEDNTGTRDRMEIIKSFLDDDSNSEAIKSKIREALSYGDEAI